MKIPKKILLAMSVGLYSGTASADDKIEVKSEQKSCVEVSKENLSQEELREFIEKGREKQHCKPVEVIKESEKKAKPYPKKFSYDACVTCGMG